jgi:hypothetical protein
MKRFHYVYQITDNTNGKIYIGKRSSTVEPELDTAYMGSGTGIQMAIAEKGKENFTKTILATFDTEDEAYAYEAELVTDEFVARDDNYNLITGGRTGQGVFVDAWKPFSKLKRDLDWNVGMIAHLEAAEKTGWDPMRQDEKQAIEKEIEAAIKEALEGIEDTKEAIATLESFATCENSLAVIGRLTEKMTRRANVAKEEKIDVKPEETETEKVAVTVRKEERKKKATHKDIKAEIDKRLAEGFIGTTVVDGVIVDFRLTGSQVEVEYKLGRVASVLVYKIEEAA